MVQSCAESVVWLGIGREIVERHGWSRHRVGTKLLRTLSKEGPSGGQGRSFMSVAKECGCGAGGDWPESGGRNAGIILNDNSTAAPLLTHV